MNFEVNGVTYYLVFNEGDDRWAFLTPINNGFRRLPVSDDTAHPLLSFPAPQDDDEQQTVN